MRRIRKLDDQLIAQIAAGEVIESPAAIVKELIENSIDSGATEIDIIISGDGFTEIQVRDNGSGIHRDDLELAVTSFATSKIATLDELVNTQTMGFRGEALGSIAAVSRIVLESCAQGENVGHGIRADELGKEIYLAPIEKGTRICVRDLFYNIPVRREYFKNAAKIRRQLSDVLAQITAGNWRIAFRYEFAPAEGVVLPARERLIDRIADIWGKNLPDDVMPIYHEANGFALQGYISKFYFYRTFASDTRLWVNNRSVEYKPLTMMLRNAYGELMPKGRFPFASLFLTLAPSEVDVNVHPQKREIRFKREAELGDFLRKAFRDTISSVGGIRAENMVRLTSSLPAQAPALIAEANFTAPQLTLMEVEESQQEIPLNLILHARIFNTFILASNDEGVYLIDQHTAHERINYEKFLTRLGEREGVSQALAVSVQIREGAFAQGEVSAMASRLEQLGFSIDNLGPAGLALRAVPFYIQPGDEEAALVAIVRQISKSDETDSAALFDQMAKDLSCRHAIRKGETASLADFRELVDELKKCDNPLRCPHGRPTIVKLDEREVFALFKRSV